MNNIYQQNDTFSVLTLETKKASPQKSDDVLLWGWTLYELSQLGCNNKLLDRKYGNYSLSQFETLRGTLKCADRSVLIGSSKPRLRNLRPLLSVNENSDAFVNAIVNF